MSRFFAVKVASYYQGMNVQSVLPLPVHIEKKRNDIQYVRYL